MARSSPPQQRQALLTWKKSGRFAAHGHQTLVELELDSEPSGSCLDAALAICGRQTPSPRAGQASLLWLISHPDDVADEQLERFDAVLVASRPYARTLAERLTVPIEAVLQFTDGDRFYPEHDPVHAHPVSFVGNWRSVLRPSVWATIRAGRPPALYGSGWRFVAPEHVVADHIPHDELRRVYSSCDVLLNDHWDDMRRHGFISNRVFDALACEAFLLSDDLPALEEELPGFVETYRDRAELLRQLDHWLPREAERRERGRKARRVVLEHHAASQRALEIVGSVRKTLSRRASAR